jgi:hypothetical protein
MTVERHIVFQGARTPAVASIDNLRVGEGDTQIVRVFLNAGENIRKRQSNPIYQRSW